MEWIQSMLPTDVQLLHFEGGKCIESIFVVLKYQIYSVSIHSEENNSSSEMEESGNRRTKYILQFNRERERNIDIFITNKVLSEFRLTDLIPLISIQFYF